MPPNFDAQLIASLPLEEPGRPRELGPHVSGAETIPDMGLIYCGDNLDVLREYLPRESVDLVYLDPPFNSQRTYNLVYKDQRAQEEAFKDFWSWEEAAPTFAGLINSGDIPKPVRALLKALHEVLIDTDSDQLAYLTMMTPRLVALHRTLKPTGSPYLHCDPTASHYLKTILDVIFGPANFLAEVVWKRYGAHGDAHGYGAVHDVILFYGKSRNTPFYKQFVPYTEEYAESRFRLVDQDGRRYQEQNLSSPNPRPNLTYPYKASNGITYQPHQNGWKCEPERMKQLDREGRLHFPKDPKGRLRLKMYLDESEGVALQDVWTDILLPSSSKERLGYPTQKPLALLERIIKASTKPGDLVLDPFCGCGTTVEAAERLGRRWIGIDIARKAIEVIEDRFKKVGLEEPEIVWHPADIESAKALAARDKLGFEKWVLRKIRAARLRKKDRGIDGEAFFKVAGGKTWHVIVSVKGGQHLPPTFGRDLRGTLEREKAIGVLVSLVEPGKEMRLEAARADFLSESDNEGPIPRLQLVTVERLFSGLSPIRCPGENVTEMPKPSVPPGAGDQLAFQLPAETSKDSLPNTEITQTRVKARPGKPGPTKTTPKVDESDLSVAANAGRTSRSRARR